MNIILIHGAMHTGQCWNELTQNLIAKGFEVEAPTLSGHGLNKRHGYRCSMSTYVKDVCAIAEQLSAPCVLIGHSMGGLVISAAAQARPDLFCRLIYLTALVPEKTGSSLSREARVDTSSSAVTETRPVAKFDLFKGTLSIEAEYAKTYFYNRYKGNLQPLLERNLCTEPFGSFLSVVKWTDNILGAIPKDYIECTQDRALPITRQRILQSRMNFDRIKTLESDHSPFACMPENLASCIADLLV